MCPPWKMHFNDSISIFASFNKTPDDNIVLYFVQRYRKRNNYDLFPCVSDCSALKVDKKNTWTETVLMFDFIELKANQKDSIHYLLTLWSLLRKALPLPLMSTCSSSHFIGKISFMKVLSPVNTFFRSKYHTDTLCSRLYSFVGKIIKTFSYKCWWSHDQFRIKCNGDNIMRSI